MISALLVALGGGLGALARWQLGGWLAGRFAGGVFPWGTFVVNVLGCLAAGALAGLARRYSVLSPEARLFVFTGLLGGFTTFSAFGLETVTLLREGERGVAFAYAAASVAFGVGALWLALALFARELESS